MNKDTDSTRAVVTEARTNLLTEEEKRRIIAEVTFRSELLREISNRESDSAKQIGNGLSAHLNSPFFITVIGGIILALLGSIFQFHNAQAESDQAYVQTVRERKYDLLRAFTGDLDYQIRTSAHLNIELKDLEGSKRSAAYTEQLQRDYEELYQQYLKTPQDDSYADQIKAMFHGKDVETAATNFFQAKKDAFSEAAALLNAHPTSPDLETQYYTQINNRLSPTKTALLQAMIADIEHTRAGGR